MRSPGEGSAGNPPARLGAPPGTSTSHNPAPTAPLWPTPRPLGAAGSTVAAVAPTQPHQAPAISCSCHITILPGAYPNNRRDCGRRKPEGDGTASRAGFAGDPHAAPRCPARCPPCGTLGWDSALPDPTAPLSHPNPHPIPQCQRSVSPRGTHGTRGSRTRTTGHRSIASTAPRPPNPLLPPVPGSTLRIQLPGHVPARSTEHPGSRHSRERTHQPRVLRHSPGHATLCQHLPRSSRAIFHGWRMHS